MWGRRNLGRQGNGATQPDTGLERSKFHRAVKDTCTCSLACVREEFADIRQPRSQGPLLLGPWERGCIFVTLKSQQLTVN